MKKSLVASAVAAAVLAGPASAMKLEGSDYAIEVNVDVGAYYADYKSNKSSKVVEPTIQGEDVGQIEIKGYRKLPNGVKVFGEIEVDYDAVNGSTVETDDTKIGVKGDFGTFTAGQFDTYFEDKISEALGREVASAKVTEPMDEWDGDNDTNHVQYKNKLGNTEFAVDMSFKTDSGYTDDGTYAFTMKQKMSGVTFAAGYATYHEGNANSWGANAKFDVSDNTSLTVAYIADEVDSEDETFYGFALDNKMGDVTLSLVSQRADVGGVESTEYGINMEYEVYKDFNFFLGYVSRDETKKAETKNEMGDIFETGFIYSF